MLSLVHACFISFHICKQKFQLFLCCGFSVSVICSCELPHLKFNSQQLNFLQKERKDAILIGCFSIEHILNNPPLIHHWFAAIRMQIGSKKNRNFQIRIGLPFHKGLTKKVLHDKFQF